jgi:micrococcal nuclease
MIWSDRNRGLPAALEKKRIGALKANKKRHLLAWSVLPCLLGVLLVLSSGFPAADEDTFPESGTVVRISDGDTVTIKFADGIERRVRLIGVDCPEMDDPREDVAFHAFLSTRFAFHHLYRRDVRLTFDFSPLDEHGRVLAYVWSGEEKLFNDFIIRQGFAAAFLKYPYRKDYQKRFRAAEAEARKENRGFWRQGAPANISVSEVRNRLGEIISVRFRCAEISQKKSFLYLRSAEGIFEVPVPRNRLPFFPGIESCVGKEVIVTGFLEEFGGQPQIMLSFPRQLRLT